MGINWRPGMNDLLFVYGSLKQNGKFHRLIQKEIDIVKSYPSGSEKFFVRGTLIDLGKYPGLVQGNGKVWGELFSITDRGLQICHTIEGYEPKGKSLYYPLLQPVYNKDGAVLYSQAIVYFYNAVDTDFSWENNNCKLIVERNLN